MGTDSVRTFFTADTHFGHRLMALHRGHAPGADSRDDVALEHVRTHDEDIVASWNSVVSAGDVVWHLGDLTVKHTAEIADTLRRLNGRIRLVVGNHDRAHPHFRERAITAQQELLRNGIEYVCTAARVTVPGGNSGRIPVMLSHFPYRTASQDDRRFHVWQLEDSDDWLLHGHTHSHVAMHAELPRQIHVGWDAWRRPVSEVEILRLIRSA
ncbi:phosphohydrolase [Brachybacterium sp. SW0106-09]|uniref:metallophosphoesterase family protein n=1 Tax=Brachybacterium sp. SW0106-09 TaxID=1704590 RepID=UPI0006B5875B|nr:metallophosphoesterase family protein [Brachybacterium sp. SW0106-09]GAP78586.1 phosphohydrolase [Brachybacterium sp. SW0106-09]